jgi:Spy/CpxP family protein refolding chaperone
MRTLIGTAFLAAAMFCGTALIGQPPAPGTGAKAEPKAEPKARGQLPQNWKNLGLTDKQVQDVYKIQAKHGEEIDKLEAKIKEHKDQIAKERLEILTPEQKKRLEEILKGKAGTEK